MIVSPALTWFYKMHTVIPTIIPRTKLIIWNHLHKWKWIPRSWTSRRRSAGCGTRPNFETENCRNCVTYPLQRHALEDPCNARRSQRYLDRRPRLKLTRGGCVCNNDWEQLHPWAPAVSDNHYLDDPCKNPCPLAQCLEDACWLCYPWLFTWSSYMYLAYEHNLYTEYLGDRDQWERNIDCCTCATWRSMSNTLETHQILFGRDKHTFLTQFDNYTWYHKNLHRRHNIAMATQ